ncbi:MAG: PIG-L family deacetylase [Clostridiales bacterium]|nr:PIG-L family deacetylase [Clostridiales bacterium]
MGNDGQNIFINLREQVYSQDINSFFPGWEKGNERVAVFSPHDDDALIGAGYAISAAMAEGAEVFIVIFCQGDCGYSVPEQKDTIVDIRRKENISSYGSLGIPAKNIIRFEYPDFSVVNREGYHLPGGGTGSFPLIFDLIREHKITRVLVPNDYREHIDHTAAFNMASYDIVQAGDPIISDKGQPQKVKSIHQYSVWADFSPEDMLVTALDRDSIRANRAILCPSSVEDNIRVAIEKFESQGQIIQDLVKSREERFTGNGYIELYIEFDPRPKLDFAPYIDHVNRIIDDRK